MPNTDPAFSPNRRIVSVVVPCYNEEEVLPELVRRLQNLAREEVRVTFDFLLVDDGSTDGTPALLRALARGNSQFRFLRFSRNFGHQIAVTAGVDASIGAAVVLIDADLQDPPEIIKDMITRWEEGYKVVYGRRTVRKGESYFKKATANRFYKILNSLSEVPIPVDTGDFRLMDRIVVDALKAMPEQARFVRGLVSWIGFRQCAVDYERAKRNAGTSKYPIRKMVKFALNGIFSFSVRPLQLSITLGLLLSCLGLIGVGYAVFMRLFTHIWIEGWTSLFIVVILFGGVQLTCIGILGEYVGRIYQEVKRRPLYFVEESSSVVVSDQLQRDSAQ